MDCSNTSTDRPRRGGRAGYSLVELMIAAGISSLVLAAALALYLFGTRSYAGLMNYVDLDAQSRNALDTMTREIRQADSLIIGDAHNMRFRFSNPTNSAQSWEVTYVYSPTAKTLARLEGGSRDVLLRECSYLNFSYFQRNPVGGTYDQYPAGSPGTVKLIQMSWICDRSIMQKAVNTESIQSAKVVIRKQ